MSPSPLGPLQALIDELELNATIATKPEAKDQGGRFHDEQFLRAIHEGSIAILRDEIREAILNAYVAMGAASRIIEAAWVQPKGSRIRGQKESMKHKGESWTVVRRYKTP